MSFGLWPLGHTLQGKFSPLCNWKFPPILHSSGLNENFEFSITRYLCEIFPKTLSSLYWWLNCTANLGFFRLVFSTQVHWLFHIAGNGDFRALTFVPLCRLYFWLDCNKLSGAFKPLIIELGNIFGNFFFSWIQCYWNFKLLHSSEKCVKYVEISGYKMLCRVCPNGQPKKRCIWPLCTIVSQFSEIVIFEKMVKIPFLQNCQLFECFSVWCT